MFSQRPVIERNLQVELTDDVNDNDLIERDGSLPRTALAAASKSIVEESSARRPHQEVQCFNIDVEALVERLKLATVNQIESALLKNHEDLLSTMRALMDHHASKAESGGKRLQSNRFSNFSEATRTSQAMSSVPTFGASSTSFDASSTPAVSPTSRNPKGSRALSALGIYSSALFLAGEPRRLQIHEDIKIPLTVKGESLLRRGSEGGMESSASFKSQGDLTFWDYMRSWEALHPDSKFKLYWDVLSVILVCFDLITVPIFFAWQLRNTFVVASSLIISIFWLVDIPISFATGYHTPDVDVERRPTKAAQKYLKGWFSMDFCLAAVDWITFVVKSNSAQQIARILKLCVRVPSKIPRMMELYASLLMRLKSQYHHFGLDLSRLIFFLIFFNHILACIWFFIGTNPILCEPNCQYTWTTENSMSERSFSFGYLTSLHWSVTQMTPASMEVVPENAGERLVNVLIILIGILLSASIVSTMTSIMTQIRVQSDAKMKSNMQLQRFLKQENVNEQLSLQVLRQVTWRLRQSKRLTTSEVHYISLTSRSLKESLNYAVYSPKLCGHNFFAAIDILSNKSMMQFCKIVRILAFAKEDSMFEKGEPGIEMYLLTTGEAKYTPGSDAHEYLDDDAKLIVSPLEWCSEPAFWLDKWVHLGSCTYLCQSEVLAPDAKDLVAAVKWTPYVWGLVEDYSKVFQDYCNHAASISDLGTIYDPVDIFYGVDPIYRYDFGTAAVDYLQRFAGRAQKKKLQVLRDEVRIGKSSIAFVCGRGVMRIVYVAALSIQLDTTDEAENGQEAPAFRFSDLRKSGMEDNKFNVSGCFSENSDGNAFWHDDTKILCEVAKFNTEEGSYQVKCNLPGTKRREQETSVNAVRRLLKGPLKDLIAAQLKVEVQSMVFDSTEVQSKSYGVYTKYVKSVFKATITERAASRLPKRAISSHDWTAENACRKAAAASAEAKWSLSGLLKSSGEADRAWPRVAQQAERLLKKCREVTSLAGGHRLCLWLTLDEMDLLAHEDAAIVLAEWVKGFGSPPTLDQQQTSS